MDGYTNACCELNLLPNFIFYFHFFYFKSTLLNNSWMNDSIRRSNGRKILIIQPNSNLVANTLPWQYTWCRWFVLFHSLAISFYIAHNAFNAAIIQWYDHLLYHCQIISSTLFSTNYPHSIGSVSGRGIHPFQLSNCCLSHHTSNLSCNLRWKNSLLQAKRKYFFNGLLWRLIQM